MPRPIIEVDRQIAEVVLTNSGFSLGFFGFVHDDRVRLQSAILHLRGKGRNIAARRSQILVDIIDPSRPGKIALGYTNQLANGFFVSCDFHNEGLSEGQYRLDASVEMTDGTQHDYFLLCVNIKPSARVELNTRPTVAIALATYNPDLSLFTRQIKSLRNQSYEDWVCFVSDDGSEARIRRSMHKLLEGDQRFLIFENSQNIGLYRNFERILSVIPPFVEFIAFCDQDDYWHPSKIDVSIQHLIESGAGAVYTDCNLLSASSKSYGLLSEYRPIDYCGFWPLLSANVATGMTMVIDRSVAISSLPFPSTLENPYHDHWLALVAAKGKGLAYIDKPLVDYTQHEMNHTGARNRHKKARSIFFEEIRLAFAIFSIPLRKAENQSTLRSLKQFNDAFRVDKIRYLVFLDALCKRANNDNNVPTWRVILFKSFLFGFFSQDRYRRGVVMRLLIRAWIEKVLLIWVRIKSR